MSCGLSDDCLLVLNILYTRRNFKSDSGLNSEFLEKIISKKTSSDFRDIVKKLKNGGYLASIDKKVIKYYIPDKPKAIFALNSHHFSVTQGRVRKL